MAPVSAAKKAAKPLKSKDLSSGKSPKSSTASAKGATGKDKASAKPVSKVATKPTKAAPGNVVIAKASKGLEAKVPTKAPPSKVIAKKPAPTKAPIKTAPKSEQDLDDNDDPPVRGPYATQPRVPKVDPKAPGPSLVPPPPPAIPMPPRPPGPPLLRNIQHLKDKPPEKLALKIGDRAVHPHRGVHEVITIEVREIGGTKVEMYVLKSLVDQSQKILVPVNSTGNAGIRPIMSPKEADSVLDTMRAKEVAVNEHPWSRRFRAYTEMINSGSPYEVAKVMRDMHRLKFDKDLSFGERRLLDQARNLLMTELALVKGVSEETLQVEVAKMFEA
jgi:CarD family transcriptional regulator